jgi:probable F420-dependent oxidoreductase
MTMGDLQLDASVYGLESGVGDLARTIEDLGFDGIWGPETRYDAFLPFSIVADATDEVQFGTRIATAFTRSPMILAYIGWDLQRYSDGRFIMGLGTQVRAHNVRRFSVDFEWNSPGPRLREVIESLRHIWDVFQGREDDLDYDGEFYSFSLLPEFFNPGPIDNPDIPIHIAGVNEYNIQLGGEKADGLAIHPFNTPKYAEEVIRPLVEKGAERGGRDIEDVTISANPFVITGETEAERQRQREEIKARIAFYGSTPSYHDVLEIHGWEDVGQRLHEISREEDPRDHTDLITDEMVDAFALEAPYDSLADEIRHTYEGVVDRIRIDTEVEEPWRRVASEF